MSIRDTIPAGSLDININCGQGNVRLSRDGWSVLLGGDEIPHVFGPDEKEYVYVDGCLVPRELIEKKSVNAGRIQVGSFITPKEGRTGWKMDIPLTSDQCGIFKYAGYTVAFNISASPVIEYEGKEFRVFEGPIEYPLSNLGDEYIGQLIDGKGILIATNVQLYDFLGRPVGPLLNYFMAPQTLGQIKPEFNHLSGFRAVDAIAQLRNVYGYDGAKIQDATDLFKAAITDVQELGKWHIPPVEILAGVSDMGGDIVNPHHIKRLLKRFDFSEARYLALLRGYQGEESSQCCVALDSSKGELVRLDASAISSGWKADKYVACPLARAEPA